MFGMTRRGIQSTSFVIQSVSSVIQSEAMNLFLVLLRVRFLTVFGMTGRGIRVRKLVYITIIHSGFQPSAEGVALFPNASHWAELTRPFRAVFQLLVVNGYLPVI